MHRVCGKLLFELWLCSEVGRDFSQGRLYLDYAVKTVLDQLSKKLNINQAARLFCMAYMYMQIKKQNLKSKIELKFQFHSGCKAVFFLQ